MQPIKMPAAWRLFLNGWNDLPTESEQYLSIVQAYFGRDKHRVPLEVADNWFLSQETGHVEVQWSNGVVSSGKADFIGTHDGASFLWADANASLRNSEAASKVRGALQGDYPAFAKPDKLTIGSRDADALTALGAERAGFEVTMFESTYDGLFVALRLSGLGHAPPDMDQVSVISKVFRRKPDNPYEGMSPFDFFRAIIGDEAYGEQTAPEDLAALERLTAKIKQKIDTGENRAALDMVESAKDHLGADWLGHLSAAWLCYAEGACRLGLGDKAGAYESFSQSLRCYEQTDATLAYRALAASSETYADKVTNLLAAYITDPAAFLEQVSEEDRPIFEAVLAGEANSRDSNHPEAVVRGFLADQFSLQKRAWNRRRIASRNRKVAGAIEADDLAADAANDLEHRLLVVKWLTLPNQARLSGYSNDPDQDPAEIKSVEVRGLTEQKAVVGVTFQGNGSRETVYTYHLRDQQGVWRVEEVWLSLSDEDIRLM